MVIYSISYIDFGVNSLSVYKLFLVKRTLMMLFEVSIKINIETQTFGNISKQYFNNILSNLLSFLLIFGSVNQKLIKILVWYLCELFNFF
jgi:hypothetical protein